MGHNDKTVTFEGISVIAESEKAIKVTISGKELWMPKSQIAADSEVKEEGDSGDLIVSEWIALEKGLI